MEKLVIRKEHVKTITEQPFVRLYDLQYREGKHYYVAARKKPEDLAAIKSDEEFRNMLPDAVTIVVILKTEEGEKLLTFYEYRYPTGHFLLSPPAGLIDSEDKEKSREEAIFVTAVRELYEETGITYQDGDLYKLLTPGLFSSPGLTDETSAVVLFVINNPDLSVITDKHSVGTEMFDGYQLLNREQVLEIIERGTDANGFMFSVQTWQALLYFVSGLWK